MGGGADSSHRRPTQKGREPQGERARAEGSGIGLGEKDGGGPVVAECRGRCWRVKEVCRSSLGAGGGAG